MMNDCSFPKSMRVCSPVDIEQLLRNGKSYRCGCLKVICLEKAGQPHDRIVVSVPKRLFKRAVKRNLLKRRIREAYRQTRKPLQEGVSGRDMMWIYTSKEQADYETIRQSMCSAMEHLS